MSNQVPESVEPLFQKISFLIILAIISGIFFYMVRNFLLTLLMAGVFTGLSYKLYENILRRVKRPVLASLATLFFLLFVLVLPVLGVILVAYHEAWDFFSSVNYASLPATIEHAVQAARIRFPTVFSHLSPQAVSQVSSDAMQHSFQFILKQGADWSVSLAANVANFFMMLFMMFYFFMDGKRILGKLIRWSPLRDDYERVLLQKFLSVSRATLKGILVIGLLQGAIGITLFWLVGMHSPVFLGVLMSFCTVVPILGTAIVWIPTAITLFATGHMVAGIAVTLVGVVVISTVDNLLRPSLVGKDIMMHDLMVLLSTLGGLGLFGLSGFVMGPILASLFLSIWTMYEEVFAAEIRQNEIPLGQETIG